MVCVCGSVDGLCLCVCGFVVVGLWLKWLVILGFRWVSDGLFFFSSFCCDAGFFFFSMGFCFGGIFVSSGQWWLGFFWVFVPMGLCVALCVELVLNVEGEREEKKTVGKPRKTKVSVRKK